MPTQTYYDILGVSRSASPAELGKSFRRRARQLHPDTNPDTDGEQIKSLNKAYDVLRDPQARAAYDATLTHRSVFTNTPLLRVEVDVPLEVAVNGGHVTVNIPVPGEAVDFSSGFPSVTSSETSNVEFTVPPLSDTGDQITNVYTSSASTHQVVAVLNVVPEEGLTYEGRELSVGLKVSVADFLLGSRRTIRVFGEQVKVSIKSGDSPQDQVTVRTANGTEVRVVFEVEGMRVPKEKIPELREFLKN